MLFSQDTMQLAIIIMIAIAVGGVAFAVIGPLLRDKTAERRIQSLSTAEKKANRQSLRERLSDDPKDVRRRQIQDSLNQLNNQEKQRKKKITLQAIINQAGFTFSEKYFWFLSCTLGGGLCILTFIFGGGLYAAIGVAIMGTLGLPRWVLNYLRTRRQKIFLNDFADAIDVLVRGLKSGLPVNDAMRIIAKESPVPVGPEFEEIIEGQKLGIPISTGIERLFERMPLPEVNFLAIVIAIQAKTGGNLAEALGNLSKVLRDRKKMKAKIRSVSQEAKSSAAIIGSLPFAIAGIVLFLNPTYFDPMLERELGKILLAGCGVSMLCGVLIMRKMIDIDV